MTAAQAASTAPMTLARGDSTAINGVRRLIQTRLVAEQASPDESDSTLALFDKGVATVKEARMANDALAQRAMAANRSSTGSTMTSSSSSGRSAGPTTKKQASSAGSSATGAGTSGASSYDSSGTMGSAADQIREHKSLDDLYQFGRTLGVTPVGAEAQALAWVVGVKRFMAVHDLPAPDKSLAAEPFFSAILNVPPPAPSKGRSAPTWSQYLAAAARSVSATSSASGARGGAVGGGPAATGDEKTNLREIVRGAEERLQLVAQHLSDTSEMRDQVEHAAAELRQAAELGPTTGSTRSSSPAPNR